MNNLKSVKMITPRYIIRLLRVKEWWDKFLHLAGSAILIGLFSDRINIESGRLIGYLVAAICLLIGGYSINDVADFAQDTAAGRKRMLKREHSLILSIVSLVISLIIIYSISINMMPCVHLHIWTTRTVPMNVRLKIGRRNQLSRVWTG